MEVTIFYTKADKSSDSHELLKKAAQIYLKTRDIPRPWSFKLAYPGEGESGKPVFADLADLHFSISHSGIFWACAFAGEEIGLDLQEDTAPARAKRLAERFLHPDEIAYLASAGYDQFCRIWAYKESYIKYTGQGLAGGLAHFSVISPRGEVRLSTGQVQTEIPFMQCLSKKDPSEKPYYMVLTSAKAVDFKIVELK